MHSYAGQDRKTMSCLVSTPSVHLESVFESGPRPWLTGLCHFDVTVRLRLASEDGLDALDWVHVVAVVVNATCLADLVWLEQAMAGK